MGQERVSMRKIYELLRLVLGEGCKKSHAAVSLNLGETTVRDCLKRAKNAGLTWQKFPQDKDAQEEIKEIAIIMNSVFEAMNLLKTKNYNELQDLEIKDADDLYKKMRQEIPSVKLELDEKINRFIQTYNHCKMKLGLKRQEDVALLTGLDRRHVSRIESGKVKPQFKTLKLLAEKFNTPIEDFLGYKAQEN